MDGKELGTEEASGVIAVEEYSEGEIGTAVERSDVEENVDKVKFLEHGDSTDVSFRPFSGGILLTSKDGKQRHWRAATGR